MLKLFRPDRNALRSIAAGILLALSCVPHAQTQEELPEGFGLSRKHPGDRGIEKDPAVLFTENFETGAIAELAGRWSSVKNDNEKPLAFSSVVPPDSAGRRSLENTATLGMDVGGQLYKKLPRAVEQAFARFYVRFAPDADYIHHFVTLGGYNPPTDWPQGGAGERPKGHDCVTVGIEPWGDWGRYPAPGMWNFYCYWHEMKVSRDGKFWGNSLRPAQPRQAPRGTWQCVEMMLKMNSAPEIADGGLALWLDGRLVAHFHAGARWAGSEDGILALVEEGGKVVEGFRWRSSKELKINFFWLMHYVTENAAKLNHVQDPKKLNRVWFDDVVVATQYIGPASPQQMTW